MKRVPEFTLGLIGSILGLFISLPFFIFMGFLPAYDELTNIAWVTNGIGTLVAIAAIVFACLVNKITFVSGIILIVAGIALTFCNFFNVVPTILLLISGIMCLVRKPSKSA